jgi:hypothetical protein
MRGAVFKGEIASPTLCRNLPRRIDDTEGC